MGLFSFNKSSGNSDQKLNWTRIETTEELNRAINQTETVPGLFFKHSTRCGISSMALSRFEKEWKETDACALYFIDLIAHRDVSNTISEITGIAHQSPQAILIDQSKVIYSDSHSGIDAAIIQSKI